MFLGWAIWPTGLLFNHSDPFTCTESYLFDICTCFPSKYVHLQKHGCSYNSTSSELKICVHVFSLLPELPEVFKKQPMQNKTKNKKNNNKKPRTLRRNSKNSVEWERLCIIVPCVLAEYYMFYYCIAHVLLSQPRSVPLACRLNGAVPRMRP